MCVINFIINNYNLIFKVGNVNDIRYIINLKNKCQTQTICSSKMQHFVNGHQQRKIKIPKQQIILHTTTSTEKPRNSLVKKY